MKVKRRTVRKIVLTAVILAAAYPLYRHWAAEKEYEDTRYFFYNLSQTIESVGKENAIEKGQAYRKELTEWNQKTEKALDRVASGFRRTEDDNVSKSIYIVETLIEDVYALRNETVSLVEPLFFQRMLNPRTVKDDAEYEWRMQVLNDVTAFGLDYKKRLLKICERFRAEIVESDLPDKYRVYIWDDWSNNLHRYIKLMGPQVEMFDGMADDYKRLFHFLHEYKDDYYIDGQGRITFENRRLAEQYQRLLFASGVVWNP